MADLDFTTLSVLITGGTGSFGQAATRRLLQLGCPRIVIFSRDERKQEDMARAFAADASRLRFFVGDVRDRDRIMRALDGIDIVLHAAALKIVPSCEYNPREAIRTNIEGSQNVADAAISNRIQKMVALSSDKAVSACTTYGATKRVMESLVTRQNVYAANKPHPRFACVRYGNVLGSRGSVVQLFRQQATNNEPLTITDPRSTRFWITLEQAVEFVLSCLPLMQGGETFVPVLPTMKVTDLAESIAPGAKQRTIGLRSSEKLHEVLVSADEAPRTRRLAWDRYVILPADPTWPTNFAATGEPVPDGFSYGSNNDSPLSIHEMRQMLGGVA